MINKEISDYLDTIDGLSKTILEDDDRAYYFQRIYEDDMVNDPGIFIILHKKSMMFCGINLSIDLPDGNQSNFTSTGYEQLLKMLTDNKEVCINCGKTVKYKSTNVILKDLFEVDKSVIDKYINLYKSEYDLASKYMLAITKLRTKYLIQSL